MPARLDRSTSLRGDTKPRHCFSCRGMRSRSPRFCLRDRIRQGARLRRCGGRRSRGLRGGLRRRRRRRRIGVGIAVLACSLVGRHVSEGEVGGAGGEAAPHAQPRHRAARREIRHRQRAATACGRHVSIASGCIRGASDKRTRAAHAAAAPRGSTGRWHAPAGPAARWRCSARRSCGRSSSAPPPALAGRHNAKRRSARPGTIIRRRCARLMHHGQAHGAVQLRRGPLADENPAARRRRRQRRRRRRRCWAEQPWKQSVSCALEGAAGGAIQQRGRRDVCLDEGVGFHNGRRREMPSLGA